MVTNQNFADLPFDSDNSENEVFQKDILDVLDEKSEEPDEESSDIELLEVNSMGLEEFPSSVDSEMPDLDQIERIFLENTELTSAVEHYLHENKLLKSKLENSKSKVKKSRDMIATQRALADALLSETMDLQDQKVSFQKEVNLRFDKYEASISGILQEKEDAQKKLSACYEKIEDLQINFEEQTHDFDKIESLYKTEREHSLSVANDLSSLENRHQNATTNLGFALAACAIFMFGFVFVIFDDSREQDYSDTLPQYSSIEKESVENEINKTIIKPIVSDSDEEQGIVSAETDSVEFENEENRLEINIPDQIEDDELIKIEEPLVNNDVEILIDEPIVEKKIKLFEKTAPDSDSKKVVYVIQKGDTLWKISKKFLGKGGLHKRIAQENNLSNKPLVPGSKLTISMLED